MRRKPRRRRDGSGEDSRQPPGTSRPPGTWPPGRERRSQSEGPIDTEQVGLEKPAYSEASSINLCQNMKINIFVIF